MTKKPLGIYIHIPFCRSKCEYCDFYSLGGGRNKELMEQYLHSLICHIREAAPLATDYVVDSIFVGGGTPSFFGADGLLRIYSEIDRRFQIAKDAEVTLEANPDSITQTLLKRLHRGGFNRISIGVQSDCEEILKALGRPHTYAQAEEAVALARKCGFDNVSVDLMYGLPNQSREQWGKTLRRVVDLKPDHISCYGLKVEENTPLYNYQHCANLPDDDTQADMYIYAAEILQGCGYYQYEISNFSREKFPCRHNIKYWTGGEYLSFGPSAASDFGGKRYTYVSDIEAYMDGVLHGGNILSECDTILPRERAGEYLMLRLRTVLGVSPKVYERQFLLPFAPLAQILEKCQAQGLAILEQGEWRLTTQGFLLSNQILSQLLLAQENSTPLT